MNRGVTFAGFVALVAALALSASAGTSVQFDPFNPNPQAQLASVRAVSAVIPASSSIVVPSAITPASTPVKPKIIYISVNDAPTVLQSTTAKEVATFTVTLSQASTQSVSVHYETANGSAVSGVDYTYSSGWLTFAPGQVSISVKVTVLPSGPNPSSLAFKDFFIDLITDPGKNSPPTTAVYGATIARGQATGLIQAPPQVVKPPTIDISVSNAVAVQQIRTAKTLAQFAVRLSQASKSSVTFHYATTNGTAEAGEDFVYASGYLTFKPGQTVIDIDVTVLPEPPENGALKTESFSLVLTSVTGATITQATGQASILSSK